MDLQQASVFARQRARPDTPGEVEHEDENSIAVQVAAGVLAEREGISPGQALERMRTRAAKDAITMTVLGHRIVQHRGWPPVA
jgi:hypothetical protein